MSSRDRKSYTLNRDDDSRASLGVIRAQTCSMSRRGAVNRLMYAITMLVQPFGTNDSATLFEVMRPVCTIAGWRSPDSIRARFGHVRDETGADQYVTMVGTPEAIMLRGLYCKMIHDMDYPGDFLYDLSFCLVTRHQPLRLDVGAFHDEMAGLLNYKARLLGQARRHTTRVLHFICLAIRNGELDGRDLAEFSDMFPHDLSGKHGKKTFPSSSGAEANYVRARERSLGMVTDRNKREQVDGLVSEASVGYVVVAISTMKGYSNLTAALSWDTLSRLKQ